MSEYVYVYAIFPLCIADAMRTPIARHRTNAFKGAICTLKRAAAVCFTRHVGSKLIRLELQGMELVQSQTHSRPKIPVERCQSRQAFL